jgi:D-glycero-alpha-D-manno-heptose-7-phosphate kinase
MIIARVPLRVSLFGGGTDFPAYYRDHGGLCLAATINKYVYVIVKRRHDAAIRVSYTRTETVSELDDLQHDLIREALRLAGVTSGVEIVTMADIPGHGSGLASSAAVTVGTLAALQPDYPTNGLVNQAIKIECDILGHTPGHQDQRPVAEGGLIFMNFTRAPHPNGVARLVASPYGPFVSEFNNHFLLFKIPSIRPTAQTILSEQNKRVSENVQALHDLKAIAEKAISSIPSGDFSQWGQWLNESWEIKKGLSPGITTPAIDSMYSAAMNAGAAGAKVCGAGGGGYLLLYCPADTPHRVRAALAAFDELEFKYEPQGVICKRLF